MGLIVPRGSAAGAPARVVALPPESSHLLHFFIKNIHGHNFFISHPFWTLLGSLESSR